MLKLIIDKKDAKRQGLSRFFTGNPCKHGHVAERKVSGGCCVECVKVNSIRYREKNLEKVRAKSREWETNNKEKVNAKVRKRRHKNPERYAAYKFAWRQANRESERAKDRERRAKNLIRNREIRSASKKRNYLKHKSDPQWILSTSLRSRLWQAIKKGQKKGSAVKDLGCTIAELKVYFEQQFDDIMTWENYGTYWHIDHIRPLSSFDLTGRTQFLQACHYTNLQPLEKIANIKKSNKQAA